MGFNVITKGNSRRTLSFRLTLGEPRSAWEPKNTCREGPLQWRQQKKEEQGGCLEAVREAEEAKGVARGVARGGKPRRAGSGGGSADEA